MSVVINTNAAATLAADNLSATHRALQQTLAQLSSGSRIVSPADDAGGLAVATKLSAAARRQNAVESNLGNAVSFLQTQDGVLSAAADMLSRIGELKMLADDPTKNSSDRANYQSEFTQLQFALTELGDATFNGRALFGTTDFSVVSTEDGGGTVSAAGIDLLTPPRFPAAYDLFTDLAHWTDTSAGSPNPTATVASGKLTLAVGGTGSASAQFQPTDTIGSFAVAFDVQFTAGTTNSISVLLGNTALTTLVHGTDIADNASHHIQISADATGTAFVYLDNHYLRTETGLAENSGKISLATTDTGAADFSNFAAWSTKPKSDVWVVAHAGFTQMPLSWVADAMQEIATFRAQNGAAQSQVASAAELVTTNRTNLQAAAGRIMDVDVASASTSLARLNVLMQAGAAMLAQANAASQLALKLLAA